jgi:hypothetical protein
MEMEIQKEKEKEKEGLNEKKKWIRKTKRTKEKTLYNSIIGQRKVPPSASNAKNV